MTAAELKEALAEERPVVHGGIAYQKISAITYRRAAGGGICIQVELLDRSGHLVTVAASDRVGVTRIKQAGLRCLQRDKPRRTRQRILIRQAAQIIGRACLWVQRRQWEILKYFVLTLAGVQLFEIGLVYGRAQRGYTAVGGEVFALLLPLFYYLFSAALRDLTDAMKRIGKKGDDSA